MCLKISTEVATFAVPAITALFIYYAGVMSDNRRRIKRIKEERALIFDWSSMVKEIVYKQMEAIHNLSVGIENSDDLNPIQFFFMRNMADKIGDVSAERMTSLFIVNSNFKHRKRGKIKREEQDNKRKMAVFNLVSQYDFLKSLESEIRNKYEDYRRDSINLCKSWNELANKTQADLDAMSIMASTSATSIRVKEAYEELDKVVRNYYSVRKKDFSIQIANDHLIIPLNNAVDNCKKRNPDLEFGHDVYMDAYNMKVLYNQWNNNRVGYSASIKSTVDILGTCINTFDNAISFLRKETNVKH